MKKLDGVLIIIIVFIAVFSYAWYFKTHRVSKDDNLYVEIHYNNKEIARFPLDEATDEVFRFERDGKLNIVHITYTSIKMTDANCPDKLCMRMFMNYKTHRPIICTNGIVIQIVGRSNDDIDDII